MHSLRSGTSSGRLHGKKQEQGVEYSHTRINESYQEYDYTGESEGKTVLIMLKSKVWLILVIVVGVLFSLAIGVGIYFLIQAQQSVII